MSQALRDLPRCRAVSTADGSTISYLSIGRGPPVIIVPGVLSTTADLASFADVLGRTHTVHAIDGRGRGRSSPQGDAYSIVKECEDVAAVQAATGAEFIFGHSYGGLIALECAKRSRVFRKVAVYEPGVSVAGSIALDWMNDCKDRLSRGRRLEALAGFSIAAGPRRARAMPLFLMTLMLSLVIGGEQRRRMLALLPACLREHQVIGDLNDTYPDYRLVHADVLAMRGGRSDLDWVDQCMASLKAVLPSVAMKTFSKLDHFGPTQSGPRHVANAVDAFLQSS